jgi:hypothetical protein
MPLLSNKGKSFQGSIVLGKGFVLSPEQAEKLIKKDPRNKDVIFPYLNGDDLNNDPEQKPSRWVINFFDWDEEKAKTYPDCYEIIEKLVKPERQRWKKDNEGNEIIGVYAQRGSRATKWWQHAERASALYNAISELDQVMVVGQVAKHPSFDFVNIDQVLDAKLVIIISQNFSELALLQSNIHFSWIVKYATTLETRLNYTPTVLFETFPFPLHNSCNRIEYIGREYHKKRRQLTMEMNLGFTKLYNLFHSNKLRFIDKSDDIFNDKLFESKNGKEAVNLKRHLQTEKLFSIDIYNRFVLKILELRQLQIELDRNVLDVYDWADVSLNHNFHQLEYLSESDNIRFTIDSESRKEILKRLLLLNLRQYNEESKTNNVTKRLSRRTQKVLSESPIKSLFPED